MSSYVIAGASRGIGFELIRQLSANPSNIVIGLVRNVESAKEKTAAEIGRSNIHIIHADLNNYKTFPDAVAAVSKITAGKLDYLIGNAAVGGDVPHLSVSELAEDHELLENQLVGVFRTNAVSYAHLVHDFMPLILQGKAKKVILLTTGLADIDLTRQYDAWFNVPYSVSKAALNMIIAKYSAEYREKGVLVMGISPGAVNTTVNSDPVPEPAVRAFEAMLAAFKAYEPQWNGFITTEESVKKVLSVIEKASIENGNAGDFISHLGTRRWL